MTHATRHASTGLAALTVLSLGHWARAAGVFASPVATFILGVLPNVAAAVAIPSITAGALADMRKNRQVPIDLRTFTMLNLGSVAGLVAWEFVQRGSLSLRFDPADLVATVVGAVVAQWTFREQSSFVEGRSSG
jgi:uncharacterized membrane protein YeaQ/YmgE (transglycosylase-associated protein family)